MSYQILLHQHTGESVWIYASLIRLNRWINSSKTNYWKIISFIKENVQYNTAKNSISINGVICFSPPGVLYFVTTIISDILTAVIYISLVNVSFLSTVYVFDKYVNFILILHFAPICFAEDEDNKGYVWNINECPKYWFIQRIFSILI